MCSHWQANSVASRRVLASRSIRRVWAASTSGSCSRPAAASCAQFVVGLRRPEEIAQPARQLPVGDRRLASAPGTGFSTRYRNAGDDEHARERQAKRFVVRHLLLRAVCVERAQLARFSSSVSGRR